MILVSLSLLWVLDIELSSNYIYTSIKPCLSNTTHDYSSLLKHRFVMNKFRHKRSFQWISLSRKWPISSLKAKNNENSFWINISMDNLENKHRFNDGLLEYQMTQRKLLLKIYWETYCDWVENRACYWWPAAKETLCYPVTSNCCLIPEKEPHVLRSNLLIFTCKERCLPHENQTYRGRAK